MLAEELKELKHPESEEQSKSECECKEERDEDGVTLGESPAEAPNYVFLGTHDTKWP